MTFMKGTVIIILCGAVSFSLAITAITAHQKSSGLSNFLIPFVVGLVEVLLFMIISMITKNKAVRRIGVIVLCGYLLYVGFALHNGKDVWLVR